MSRLKFAARVLVASLFLLLELPLAAHAASNWTVEAGSRLGFIATQGGVPIEGDFERFDATITFSADNLAASAVDVTIDIASVNSKSKDRDSAIVGPGLFDTAKWPTAAFKTEAFHSTGAGQFAVDAVLTMRGINRPVTMPFTLVIKKHPSEAGHRQALAKGRFTVKRLDYGIGQGAWKDTSVVGNDVIIFLDLKAKRKIE